MVTQNIYRIMEKFCIILGLLTYHKKQKGLTSLKVKPFRYASIPNTQISKQSPIAWL